jgi:hypothetical protein
MMKTKRPTATYNEEEKLMFEYLAITIKDIFSQKMKTFKYHSKINYKFEFRNSSPK